MADNDYGHWDIDLVGEFNPDDHLGFVYRITRLDTGKAYIGCKHLWKFKRGSRKRIRASEWRFYCSSSNYLKPEIEELGKEFFSFEILMLCDTKRDLYYNEMKLQVELGVLEDDTYYNANIGGMRFYRPVKSYLTPELIERMSGTNNHAYKGAFYITYKSGEVEKVEDKTVRDWCSDNGFTFQRVYDVRNGKRKTHKGIVKMEYEHERKVD